MAANSQATQFHPDLVSAVLEARKTFGFDPNSRMCPKRFLFEPALEPGISQQILDELTARNIRRTYYTTGARECRPTEWQDTPPAIRFYGFNEPRE